MTVLLDTSAYSALCSGQPEVAGVVRRAKRIYLSAVMLGEVLFGIRNGTRVDEGLARLDRFRESAYVETLPVTSTTADRFARIMVALRSKGTPIPTNDIWIAAHAMETGAELVSADRHFEAVDGLVYRRIGSA